MLRLTVNGNGTYFLLSPHPRASPACCCCALYRRLPLTLTRPRLAGLGFDRQTKTSIHSVSQQYQCFVMSLLLSCLPW